MPLSALRNSDTFVVIVLSCFMGTAALTEKPGLRQSTACYPLVAYVAVYSFLFLPLGLQDNGNVRMFANLHNARPGAGNHHFLPTSLLHDYAVSLQATAA